MPSARKDTSDGGVDLSDLGGEEVDLSDLGGEEVKGASGAPEAQPLNAAAKPQYTPDGEVVEWPTRAPVSETAATARGFSQGLTSNWGDELLGRFAQAFPSTNISLDRLGEQWGDILAGRIPRAGDQPNLQGYEANRDYFRNLNAASAAAHPLDYGVGQVAGGIVQAGSPLGKALPLGQPGLGNSMWSGGLAGLGGSNAENVVGQGEDMLKGGLLGGIASMGGEILGRGLTSLATRYSKPLVTPTPEAQQLGKYGVELTLGQQDPKSAIGQLEAANTSASFFGPELNALREQSMGNWQNAAMREGMPPGLEPPPAGMPLKQQQARAYEELGEAYAPFKPVEVPPYSKEIVPGRTSPSGEPLTRAVDMQTGFERAVNDPSIASTAETREAVARVLRNELTALPSDALEPGGRVTFGVLQKMRSNIRDQVRNAMMGGAPDPDKAGMFANAEQYITDLMESQLPEDARQALKAIDQKYAQHKVLENALWRAGDKPTGFTPFQLQEAVRSGAPRGAFVRDEVGGPLRELEEAGQAVFQAPPMTGVRPAMVRPQWLTAPSAVFLNTVPTLRNAALGKLPSQVRMRAGGAEALGQAANQRVAETLKALGRSSSGATTPPAEALRKLAANPQAMGKYGPELQRAQAQGDDALITYDFMRSSTDPEYQRLKREAAGAPAP